MTKIIIMGAGVGGLAIAHKLIKRGYDIHVYERHESAGGQARSKQVGNKFSEYCWHALSMDYTHMLKMLKEIPYEDKTVYDNLVPLDKFFYARANKTYVVSDVDYISHSNLYDYKKFLYNMKKEISFYDYYLICKIYLIAKLTSEESLHAYDNILWLDYVKDLSEETFRWLGMSPSIYLGMDITNLSTYTMLKLIKRLDLFGMRDFVFYSFNGPFHEKLFIPWVKYLEDSGVHFHFNSTVQKICINENKKITHIMVKTNNTIIVDIADIYINSLPIEQYAKLISNSVEESKKSSTILKYTDLHIAYKQLSDYSDKLTQLANKGHQIQTQVLIEINKKIKDIKIIVLPDSPWFLMIKVESNMWTNISNEILSVGIGLSDVVGYNGKKMIDCNHKEIIDECIKQIWSTESLVKNIKLNTGECMSDVKIINTNIWESFRYEGHFTTYEPKFSNSVGTLQLRPNITCCIHNLYNSNAYTVTNQHIFNMESACEAAHLIDAELHVFDL